MKAIPLRCAKAVPKEALKRYPGVQFLDARLVAGMEHLEFAISQAEKAFQRGENISSDPLFEVLVRASAQRQIKRALELVGLKGGREVILLCHEVPEALLQEYGCREDPGVLAIGRDKYELLKEAFGIGEAELDAVAGEGFAERSTALVEAIKERIAILQV
ncbi:MAG: KEOPS complex subunit Cgi121 [Candidatus Hydrothermarchaeota archaeon]